MKKRTIGFVFCVLAVILIIAFFGCKKKTDEVLPVQEVLQNEREEKNISGIAQLVFADLNITHSTTIEEKEIAGEMKEWLVVQLDRVDEWNSLESEKKEEILKDLINTSRLQIDRDFGGVQIIFEDNILIKGRWSSKEGYVIM